MSKIKEFNPQQKRKRGRPAAAVPRKMFFGVVCTEAERDAVRAMMKEKERKDGRFRITVAEFFLGLCGLKGQR